MSHKSQSRWVAPWLSPLMLALLAACGGGASGESSDNPGMVAEAAQPTMKAQAAIPATFRHPGIFLTQARLDAFKAATNATNPSVIKIGYQAVLDDARSQYTYAKAP